MNEAQVKSLLFREFLAWMAGQTASFGPDGDVVYFPDDVEKFTSMVRRQIVEKYLGVTD
jgi:hypothetical protein